MSKKNTTPLESEEQIQFVKFLDEKGVKYCAVPNGTYTNSVHTKVKAKREGVKAGFPDLLIFLKSPKNHSFLALEMKRQKGGKLSEKQKDWVNWLDNNDYAVAVAQGCASAISILDSYTKGEY